MADFDPIGSVIGYVGQQETNAANQANALAAARMSAEEAQKNRAWQEMMSNTAYQRQVADLSAAGLNPMLAYIKGGGASTPSGSTGTVTAAQYTSPVQGALQGRLTSAQSAKTEAEIEKTKVDTAFVSDMSDKVHAEISNINMSTKRIRAEIDEIGSRIGLNETQAENLVFERERIRAVISNLQASNTLMVKQGKTEEARAASLNAGIKEIVANGDMAQAAYKAMKDTGFVGVIAREVKPVSDISSEWVDKLMPKNWFTGKSKSEQHENIIRDKDGRVVGRERYSSSSSR